MPKISMNWFDFVVIVALIFGLFRGRKNGMSEELLPLVQVLLMVVLGGRFYQQLGDLLLTKTTIFSKMWCYIFVYVGIVLVIKIVFGAIKRKLGEKVLGADLFGRMEFYFGMLSGIIRYAGIVIMVLAVMNAKAISKEEMDRMAKLQKENFGDISFPTYASIQDAVLNKSFTGPNVKKYVGDLLIQPSSSKGENIRSKQTLGREREKAVDELMKGRK